MMSEIVLAAVLVAGTLTAAIYAWVREQRARRREILLCRLLGLFTPAAASAQQDPRQLLIWYPVALAARHLFPAAFAELDRGAGRTFPFTADDIQSAHARVTADWLAWERSHDLEYRTKTEAIEGALARGEDPAGRARLEEVEREKLERYQRRYEEYVRTARALAALGSDTHGDRDVSR